MFVSSTVGWVVGDDDTILYTDDGGDTWQDRSSGFGLDLNNLFFVNTTTGWVVGDDGVILKTEDAGVTWTSQESGTDAILKSVFFNNDTNGWIVGNDQLFWQTTDGGDNWELQSNSWSAWLGDVFFVSDCGWITPYDGSGSTIIYRTTDEGGTWTDVDAHCRANNIFFADENNGWVVGRYGIIAHSTDGGSTWATQGVGSNILR